MIKLLVTGGREFRNLVLLETTLNDLKNVGMVIHGGARGADTMADLWAKKNGIHTARCDANWDKYKNSAGPKRNRAMLLLDPDLVVAFPGGTGTAGMVRLAKEAGIKVIEINEKL